MLKLKLPFPDLTVDSIFHLTPDLLKRHGIELLLIDLDNTIAPYGHELPSSELQDWVRSNMSAGIQLCIVSNNRGNRPEQFARTLEVRYIKRARKPFTRETKKLLKELGASINNTALAGDQIFTDVLCARRIGIISIAVIPISLRNPLIRARYFLELPFRASVKKNGGNAN